MPLWFYDEIILDWNRHKKCHIQLPSHQTHWTRLMRLSFNLYSFWHSFESVPFSYLMWLCFFSPFLPFLIKILLLRWMAAAAHRLRKTLDKYFHNKVCCCLNSFLVLKWNFPMANHPETRIEWERVWARKPHQNLCFGARLVAAKSEVVGGSLLLVSRHTLIKPYEPWSVKKLWRRASVSCCERRESVFCSLYVI